MANKLEHLDWMDTQSSNIQSVAYHEPSKTLAVKFIHGGLYSYMGINEEMYVDLVHAQSVGQYLNQVIKATFPYTRWENESQLIDHLNIA